MRNKVKMQPLGLNGDLEADASCQEEDEKEEAYWLREQGHGKMTSVQDHLFQSSIGCSGKKVKAAAQGCWRRHGRVAGLLVMVGKEVGVDHRAGQRKGCRSWQS